jgi:hypothetical protein
MRQTGSYPHGVGKIPGKQLAAQHDEVEVIVVRRPGPRWRPVRLLCHDSLDEAVGAVREGGTVLAHRTVHKTQMLEEKQFAVRVKTIQGLPPERMKKTNVKINGTFHLPK